MTDADGDTAAAGTPPAPAETAPAEPVAPGGRGPEGGGDVQSYIGARLRQAFDDIAKQPVPDRFLQLMRDLDRT